MQAIQSILAIIGALTVISYLMLAFTILVVPKRRPRPDNHPETQDDFRASIERHGHIQETMSK